MKNEKKHSQNIFVTLLGNEKYQFISIPVFAISQHAAASLAE